MGGSWLDTGHGDGESLAHVTGVPARDIVAPSDLGSASWNSRSTKAVVGALAALALIGSAGTAYAIRETLFPSLGAPTSRSVWTNTPAPDESAEVTVSSVTTSTSTVPPETTAPAETSTVPATVTSVEESIALVDAQASTPRPTSGTSDRRGSASNTVAPATDNSGSDHADTTEPVSNTGPSVPESGDGSVPTTDDNDSSGSGSGSGGDSDNSGSGRSGGGDDRSDEPDEPNVSSDLDD